MESVLRALVIYVVLLTLFRFAGRRTLSQMTNFDLILLILIGESAQQGLVSEDFSLTNAFLVVTTLIVVDVSLSLLKRTWPIVEKWVDGLPLVIVDEGRLLRDRMARARIAEEDILTAARQSQGLERLDQIKYAVLERSGGISIIPK